MTDRLTDPYGELGVARDATDAAISAAWRKLAATCHPDANPEPDAAQRFARAAKAVAVLRNPAKRKLFDETGRVDDTPTDALAADAAAMLNQFIEEKIGAYINGGFADNDDPRQVDLLGEFREKLTANIDNANAQIRVWQKARADIADMARRFKGGKPTDVLHRAFELRQLTINEKVDGLGKIIATSEAAIELAKQYRFEWSEREDVPWRR